MDHGHPWTELDWVWVTAIFSFHGSPLSSDITWDASQPADPEARIFSAETSCQCLVKKQIFLNGSAFWIFRQGQVNWWFKAKNPKRRTRRSLRLTKTFDQLQVHCCHGFGDMAICREESGRGMPRWIWRYQAGCENTPVDGPITFPCRNGWARVLRWTPDDPSTYVASSFIIDYLII